MNVIAILDDDEPKTPLKKQKTSMEDKIDVLEIVDVDSFTPRGTSKSNPISVDQYVSRFFIHLHGGDEDDDIRVLTSKPAGTPFRRRNRSKPFSSPSITETGQSSKSQFSAAAAEPFVCEICVEPKPQNESFSIKGCAHSYCADCMNKYVASKLQENVTSIRCPVSGCGGLLEPEHCRRILPAEVFDRWGNALCEAVIIGAQKFYCPYKDCSALLIDDGGEAIEQSECPNCWRLFCAQCKVPWHSGIGCEEFQKLNEDERGREDIMVRQLAKNKNWSRCPSCNFYVEKVQGCMFVVCRCRIEFCYRCGTRSTKSHYCGKCKC